MRIAILFISIFLCLKSFSQKDNVKIQLGSTLSTLNGSDAKGFNPNTGFQIGIGYDRQLSKKLFIGLNLSYLEIGDKKNNYFLKTNSNRPVYFSADNITEKLVYYSINPNIKYKISDKFRLGLGVEINIMDKDKSRIDFKNNNNLVNKNDDWNSLDYGMKAEATYFITKKLYSSLHVYQGFNTVYSGYYINSREYKKDAEIKNIYGGILIGYILTL